RAWAGELHRNSGGDFDCARLAIGARREAAWDQQRRVPGGAGARGGDQGGDQHRHRCERDEFYLASGNAQREPRCFRDSLRLVSAGEIGRVIASGETVLGPDLRSRISKADEVYPKASALAKLAAGRTDFVAGEQ